jgi:hypothetical protein
VSPLESSLPHALTPPAGLAIVAVRRGSRYTDVIRLPSSRRG